MHRGFAAACAAAVACATLYPVDVWKMAAQMRLKRTHTFARPYAGLLPDLGSSFLGTGVYFTTYEVARDALPFYEPYNTIIGNTCGVLTSCIVKTPLSLIKRRKQAKLAFRVDVTQWSGRLVRDSYLLDILKGLPRAIVKYVIYEHLMRLTRGHPAAAALNASISAACAYAISVPIENRKVLLTLSAPSNSLRGVSFNGLGRGMLLTVVSNAFGHALLELWAPRDC